jgi:putative chitinase
MNVTIEQLVRIMPLATAANRRAYVDPLNVAMLEFEINTEKRVEAFLAQIAWESGQLKYTHEIASGEAYEGRADLGNTQPGDGKKYKGRGPIEITGKVNYIACMMALGINCVHHPELLEDPLNGCRASAWFWKSHGLNELADAGNFEKITRRINGGLNGEKQRLALWEIAKEVIV